MIALAEIDQHFIPDCARGGGEVPAVGGPREHDNVIGDGGAPRGAEPVVVAFRARGRHGRSLAAL